MYLKINHLFNNKLAYDTRAYFISKQANQHLSYQKNPSFYYLIFLEGDQATLISDCDQLITTMNLKKHQSCIVPAYVHWMISQLQGQLHIYLIEDRQEQLRQEPYFHTCFNLSHASDIIQYLEDTQSLLTTNFMNANYNWMAQLCLIEAQQQNLLPPSLPSKQGQRQAQIYRLILDMHCYFNQFRPLNKRLAQYQVGKTTLYHHFKELVGLTPQLYLNQVILSNIISYLEDTDLPCGLIANKCGFKDAGNFSAFFKKHKNISPYQYRLIYKESEELLPSWQIQIQLLKSNYTEQHNHNL